MTAHRWTTTPTPVGTVTLVGTDAGLCGLYMEEHRHRPPLPDDAVRDDAAFGDAVAELRAYFAGELRDFATPVAVSVGTPFQHRVWDALRTVPYGTTTTYGELAVRLGVPGGARAVGLANGRNPVSIVVPCHRVIGAAGALTGYGGGVERKRFLLGLEGVVVPGAEVLRLDLAGI
ncbi:methylated-DNA--[protein]-cysteine S-methyltransferase [Patulibacter sp.]|uniref:methylated-DNA--[protein]-cysteine S-methyltransferase n=1 Tax=Patulibacter sp. TaxID=1912859 RepID=UPI002717891F|nr:methylated-DNA--[protein]-cysteine S-methyltransferase [Patulibacter sp.]MDO9407513.1 methylated-DNA--[protein]-cysteine S-methyltransferase [Patulibacter sp.]